MSNPYERPGDLTQPADFVQPPFLQRPAVRWTLRLAVCGLPLLTYLQVVVFWLAAGLVLGQPPQPGLHDPADFAYGIPHGLHVILMLSSLAVAPLVVAMGYRRRQIALHVGGYAICLVLMFVLFRADLAHIKSWIGD